MPRVPYNPVPSVEPIAPGEQIREATPPAAFGENIANALQHLGTTTEHVGDELFTRALAIQQLNNEAEARDLQMQHAQQTAPIVADFDALEGRQARDQLIPHLKRLQGVRDGLAQGASNPAVRRLFLNDTASFMQRETFSAARHAGDQYKNYIIGNAQSHADLAQLNWTDPEDQSEVDDKIKAQESAGATIAGAKGWSPDQLEVWKTKQISETYAGQLNALALRGKTEKAFALLEQYKDEGKLTQPHYEQVQKALWLRNEALGSEYLAKKIDEEMGDKSITDKMARLEELAPEYAHGDPNFQTVAEHHMRTRITYDHRIANEQIREKNNNIAGRINNDEITDFGKLQLDPDYNSLPETEKLKWNKRLPEAVNARWRTADENTMKALMSLNGLRERDPDAFQKIDPYDSAYHLTQPHIRTIVEAQRHDLKQPYQDPHVRWGKQILSEMYPDFLGKQGVRFAPKKGADPESDEVKNYDSFTGYIKAAIDGWKDEHAGKPPTAAEFKEKIAPQIIQQHSQARLPILNSLLGPKQVPDYLTEIPQAAVDKAKAVVAKDFQDKGLDVEPTDEDIRRHILLEQWKDFYQKQSAKSQIGPTSGKPGIPD